MGRPIGKVASWERAAPDLSLVKYARSWGLLSQLARPSPLLTLSPNAAYIYTCCATVFGLSLKNEVVFFF